MKEVNASSGIFAKIKTPCSGISIVNFEQINVRRLSA